VSPPNFGGPCDEFFSMRHHLALPRRAEWKDVVVSIGNFSGFRELHWRASIDAAR